MARRCLGCGGSRAMAQDVAAMFAATPAFTEPVDDSVILAACRERGFKAVEYASDHNEPVPRSLIRKEYEKLQSEFWRHGGFSPSRVGFQRRFDAFREGAKTAFAVFYSGEAIYDRSWKGGSWALVEP